MRHSFSEGACSASRAVYGRALRARIQTCSLGLLIVVWMLPSAAWAQSSWASRTLSLDEAQLLLEASTSVAISETMVEQATQMEDQAWQIFYPNVNLTGIFTINDKEIEFDMGNTYAPLAPYLQSVYDSDPGLADFFAANPEVPDARSLAAMEFDPAIIQRRFDYRAVLTVTQVLFNYRAIPLLDMAETAVAQSKNGIEQVKYQLEKGLVQLYFNALTMKRLIAVSERNVELAKIQLESAEAAFEHDVGLKFEVNRAKVSLSSAERDLENARLSYQLMIEALASLLETEPDFDVTEPPLRARDQSLELFVSSAVEKDASLQGYSLSAELSSQSAEEVDARWWPTVYAQAQAFLQQESAFGGEAFKWMITIQASWDIYDGGMNALERDQHELAEQRSQLQETQREIQIQGEVRQAYLAILSEERKVASASEEVELARENLELTQKAQALDSATYVDVEVAQRQLYLAEIALATAEVQVQARIYQLDQLAGEF